MRCCSRLRVGDGQAALDLRGELLPVELRVLGVKLAMHVRDLAHEESVDAGPRPLDVTPPGKMRGRFAHPRSDERLGSVEPGDADRHLLEVLERLATEVRRERLEQGGAVRDRAGHRADVVEARRQRETTIRRHEVVGRLEADDAAARSRDPDRATGIRSERRVGETRSEGGRRAAARAARDAAGCGGIRHRAEVRVLRRDSVGELVQVGLADVGVAGGLEPQNACRRRRRNVVGEDRGAVRGRQACGVEQVLDGEWDAGGRRLRAREEDSVGRRHAATLVTSGASASSSEPARARGA